jgi:hypothetical protein
MKEALRMARGFLNQKLGKRNTKRADLRKAKLETRRVPAWKSGLTDRNPAGRNKP